MELRSLLSDFPLSPGDLGEERMEAMNHPNDPPSSNSDDPFDPKRLRLSQRFANGADVKRALVTVPVRRPNGQEFFRVHP